MRSAADVRSLVYTDRQVLKVRCIVTESTPFSSYRVSGKAENIFGDFSIRTNECWLKDTKSYLIFGYYRVNHRVQYLYYSGINVLFYCPLEP